MGSNDPAAAPQEMGTSRMPPRPFLAPAAAEMGEEVAWNVAEALVAALEAAPEGGAIILAGTLDSGQTRSVPYNPLGLFQPGSPENESWTHGTIQRLQELGRVFHSKRPDSEHDDESKDAGAPPVLPANPDDLLQQGWEEISHPNAVAKGHRTFRNKQTGMVVRADQGGAGEREIAEDTIIILTIRIRRANAISVLTKTVIRCQGEAMPHISCQKESHDELVRPSRENCVSRCLS